MQVSDGIFPYPIQDVELVDVSSVRKAEIGMKGTTLRLKEALMLTDDENIVDVMFNVQYRIKDGPGAEEFFSVHAIRWDRLSRLLNLPCVKS